MFTNHIETLDYPYYYLTRSSMKQWNLKLIMARLQNFAKQKKKKIIDEKEIKENIFSDENHVGMNKYLCHKL